MSKEIAHINTVQLPDRFARPIHFSADGSRVLLTDDSGFALHAFGDWSQHLIREKVNAELGIGASALSADGQQVLVTIPSEQHLYRFGEHHAWRPERIEWTGKGSMKDVFFDEDSGGFCVLSMEGIASTVAGKARSTPCACTGTPNRHLRRSLNSAHRHLASASTGSICMCCVPAQTAR